MLLVICSDAKEASDVDGVLHSTTEDAIHVAAVSAPLSPNRHWRACVSGNPTPEIDTTVPPVVGPKFGLMLLTLACTLNSN